MASQEFKTINGIPLADIKAREDIQTVASGLQETNTEVGKAKEDLRLLTDRVHTLEDNPSGGDGNTTYSFSKAVIGGVENLVVTPSEGTATRIPLPNGITETKVQKMIDDAVGSLEALATEIDEVIG